MLPRHRQEERRVAGLVAAQPAPLDVQDARAGNGEDAASGARLEGGDEIARPLQQHGAGRLEAGRGEGAHHGVGAGDGRTDRLRIEHVRLEHPVDDRVRRQPPPVAHDGGHLVPGLAQILRRMAPHPTARAKDAHTHW